MIWVFSEDSQGAPSTMSLELLAAARGLGDDIGAIHVGPASADSMATLGDHGAATVYHLDTGDQLPAAAAAAAIAELAGEHEPKVILFGLTFTDRDVAGRLSARMGLPVLSNVVSIDGTSANNEILGGTLMVTTQVESSGPTLMVVRPKAFTAEPVGGPAPTVVEVAVPDVGHSGAATITARHAEDSSGPSLEEANVIITGGRGLGAAEAFGMMEELAGLLGAAVGATRAVVDSGWVPYSLQVGQTGKTVKPSVYVACGVSGAMQHLVGMKDSGTIIAINKDPEAPIFGIADLGIVGDVHSVVPKLIEVLTSR
ncbi:MAG: electron transfer flavoprotein subunit alpha/FixB family protein [Acidimicrobiia bacterium]